MANQIVQRLIAAGASPQRASQFATQFQKSLPGSKPREIQDAFDAEIAALSKAFYPNTFQPPSMESPQFLDYAVGVLEKILFVQSLIITLLSTPQFLQKHKLVVSMNKHLLVLLQKAKA